MNDPVKKTLRMKLFFQRTCWRMTPPNDSGTLVSTLAERTYPTPHLRSG
jgi:hypothetical protein